MKKPMKRKAAEGKRSMNLIVRVSPELRYLAEIAARVQRRTVSSFAEWAVEQALFRVFLDQGKSVGDLRFELWDVDEADRFGTLALRYPGLLTHEEQVLWKLIDNDEYYWKKIKTDKDGYLNWNRNENNLDWEALREWWDALKQVAKGEQSKSVLPTREDSTAGASASGQEDSNG
jgi:hypothetical protein